MKITDKEAIKEKLLENRWINKDTGCWEWLGSRNFDGHGKMRVNVKMHYVHRLSLYVFTNFNINSNLQVLHKLNCPFTWCFNYQHLYPGTQSQNMIDRVKVGHDFNAKKTHCIRGHEFNKENTYVDAKGNRNCKLCKVMLNKNYHLSSKLP